MVDEVYHKLLKEDSYKTPKNNFHKVFKYLIISLIFCCVAGTVVFFYFCENNSCLLFPKNHWNELNYKAEDYSSAFNDIRKLSNVKEDIASDGPQFDFNLKGSDVIVFLHVQNTGGNVFARHLVEDLALEKPCVCKRNRKQCKCFRPNKLDSTWLFSRYTMGWKCGVHPDWAELTSCVDQVMDEEEGKPVKRRYFYTTLLRDPIKRFISEFWHIRQGSGSWKSWRHWCNGRESPIPPSCFEGRDLEKLTLREFMSCPYNQALNRQTRMLADAALVGCDNSSKMNSEERDLLLLASAKTNLHKMAFFGLAEFPKISQYMFETTFSMAFLEEDEKPSNNRFHSGGGGGGNSGFNFFRRRELMDSLSSKDLERIKELNYLDMELFQYAKKLLFYRFDKVKQSDPEFKSNFDLVQKSNLSNGDWAEKEDSDNPFK